MPTCCGSQSRAPTHCATIEVDFVRRPVSFVVQKFLRVKKTVRVPAGDESAHGVTIGLWADRQIRPHWPREAQPHFVHLIRENGSKKFICAADLRRDVADEFVLEIKIAAAAGERAGHRGEDGGMALVRIEKLPDELRCRAEERAAIQLYDKIAEVRSVASAVLQRLKDQTRVLIDNRVLTIGPLRLQAGGKNSDNGDERKRNHAESDGNLRHGEARFITRAQHENSVCAARVHCSCSSRRLARPVRKSTWTTLFVPLNGGISCTSKFADNTELSG